MYTHICCILVVHRGTHKTQESPLSERQEGVGLHVLLLRLPGVSAGGPCLPVLLAERVPD